MIQVIIDLDHHKGSHLWFVVCGLWLVALAPSSLLWLSGKACSCWTRNKKVIGSRRNFFLPSGLCHVTKNRNATNIFLCLLLTVHITGKTYNIEILRCCHILVSGDLESSPYVFFQYIKWINSQRWSWSTSSRSSAWNE